MNCKEIMHIVIITSSAKQLFGLRRELVASWVKAGHRVTAIGDLPQADMADKCREAGFAYRHVPLSRNGVNPFADMRTLRVLTSLLHELHPDRVFCTFAKAVSYGCWAARREGIDETYALISGLGSIFHGSSVKERLVRVVVSALYKHAFKCCRTVIFQNKDDVNDFASRGLVDVAKTSIVNGSGVDLDKFAKTDLPDEPSFLFVGRLLREKGIREYVAAAREVKACHPEARFIAVGDIDTNPSSLTEAEVQQLRDEGLIDFVGFQDDVRPYLNKTRVFVLPSYHEGMPRSVLEAMAVGRPVITTDAPGCRDAVHDSVNGFLVPVGNSELLAQKMKLLLQDKSLATDMAHKSRQIAEERYDVHKVNAAIAAIMNL